MKIMETVQPTKPQPAFEEGFPLRKQLVAEPLQIM